MVGHVHDIMSLSGFRHRPILYVIVVPALKYPSNVSFRFIFQILLYGDLPKNKENIIYLANHQSTGLYFIYMKLRFFYKTYMRIQSNVCYC